jgi:flagellar biosynthetic protein FlhB
MADESDLERTEAPSERRLEKAREEGQVPRSHEATTFALLLSAGAALWWTAESTRVGLAHIVSGGLLVPREMLTDPGSMIDRLYVQSSAGLVAIAPVLGLLFLVSLVAPMMLSGWLVSTEALAPNFSRLNPLKGFGRMFSVSSLVELAKAIAKVVLIACVATWVMLDDLAALTALAAEPLQQAIVHGGLLLGKSFLAVCGSLALIAVIDVPYQIWHHRSELKMTREELRQEAKETEGDPHIKAAIRAQQRERARKRMMADVPKADVVVVNPTRYAVALRYDDATMRAPRVVAKGMHLLAGRIRELAEENAVPVLQAPPLARALYRHAEVGEEIPAPLYAAVAEVLAWVFQLRRHRTAGGPTPNVPEAIAVPAGLDPEAA